LGQLTTHVLDTAHGRPGAGMAVRLLRRTGDRHETIKAFTTNADGRADTALLEGAAYFRALGVLLPDPPFVDEVVIDFGIADAAATYHVPLLVSPWSYSTYRGS
jgi:5-hydroxyisourate hydrolase